MPLDKGLAGKRKVANIRNNSIKIHLIKLAAISLIVPLDGCDEQKVCPITVQDSLPRCKHCQRECSVRSEAFVGGIGNLSFCQLNYARLGVFYIIYPNLSPAK